MQDSENRLKTSLCIGNDKLTFLGRVIYPWAIKFRNDLVLKHIPENSMSLLDIGGGAGYLVKNSLCEKSISIDERGDLKVIKNSHGGIIREESSSGTIINDEIPFDNGEFDCVTMVAVIEHIKNPENLIREISRVLKLHGKLIMTTPTWVIDRILPFLDKGSEQLRGKTVHEEHENYFNLESMNILTKEHFKLLTYKKFQLGLNQLFVYIKKS